MRCSGLDCNEEIAPNGLSCAKCGMDAPPRPETTTPSPSKGEIDTTPVSGKPPGDTGAPTKDSGLEPEQTAKPPVTPPSKESSPAGDKGVADSGAGAGAKVEDKTPWKTPEEENVQQPELAKVGQKFEVQYIQEFKNMNFGINAKGEPLESSLIDFLSDLPSLALTDPSTTAFLRDDLQQWTQSLRTSRMILVNCNDPALSRAATMALIEELRVEPDRRKVLNFERLPAGMEPGVHHLMVRRIQPKGDTVVVADAARADRAKSFVNSIFSVGGHWTALDRTKALSDAGLLVICQTDPDRIASILAKAKELPVACWNLSYLRLRFPNRYRELETIIAKQRAAGGWSQDASELHRQVSSLNDEELLHAIATGGVSAEAKDQEDALEAENPLQLAVLYTATFYPDLSPSEFSQLLTAFIGDDKMLVEEPVKQKSKDGTFKTVALKHPKKLADVWRERSDAVLRECHLVTNTQGKRSITFADVGRRDRLRRDFEKFSGVYVHERFVAAHSHKLLFDSSEQIGQDVIALTIDMMRGSPDEFDVEWLRSVIIDAMAEVPAGATVMLVLQRVANLLQAMMEDAALAPAVPELLRRLLGDAEHHLTYELVKKLRYAPGFDAFSWLRLIFDQAPGDLRDAMYTYFSKELEQPGRTYPLLYALESWLPGVDRAPETYAPSHTMALRLGMGYFVEITRNFDRRSAGVWPSRFPIFAVDPDNANARLDLVVRWLLHPGLTAVFADVIAADELARLIGALFAEWVFILVGPPAPARNDVNVPNVLPGVDAAAVYDVLIAKVTDGSNPAVKVVQRLILEYWEELKHYLTIPPEESGGEGLRLRRERAWKRELVRRLITQSRERQRTYRSSAPHPPRVTA